MLDKLLWLASALVEGRRRALDISTPDDIDTGLRTD